MPPRLRKLIGMILLVTVVVVWALFFMALAQGQPIQEAGRVWHLVYYVVAGMGWVLPAMVIIKWMEKPAPDAD